jgi:nucleotide-binding universal stress UspA family protein
VLAADLENVHDSLLNYLNVFVGKMNSSLQLLYVAEEVQAEHENATIQEIDMKFERLEKPVKREFKLIVNNDYINGISEHVSNERPELFSIVMSSKNFIEKFLFGSLSEKMIYESNVPLLVLPQRM